MTNPTIKIGNQEVELDVAKALLHDHSFIPNGAMSRPAIEALRTAIKEAEEVEGPFGADHVALTFRGELVEDDKGRRFVANPSDAPTLNRVLSQHFVSKDELRSIASSSLGNYPYTAGGHMSLHRAVIALIEKGAPNA